MSDWEMKDWRVPPKGRYAFVFLGAAILVSSMVLGASMATIPERGGFEEEQVLQIAENRLDAVEALWVHEPFVIYDNIYDDGMPSPSPLSRFHPTDDPNVRWVVQSYFELEAKLIELDRIGSGTRIWFDDLLDTLDDKFGWVTTDGSYGAWELWFNGTMIHFGSDTVDGTNQIPDTHWTASHDYSGEIDWPRNDDTIPFRARLVFHLWFETERPEF